MHCLIWGYVKSLKLFFILLLLFSTSAFSQSKKLIIESLTPKETFQKYRNSCFPTEIKEKNRYEKTWKKCKKVAENFRDPADPLKLSFYQKRISKEKKSKIEFFWLDKCQDFAYGTPKIFDVSDPVTCVPLGEILEGRENLESAKSAYKKACGMYFNPKAYKKLKEKHLEQVQKYGCMTPSEARKYKVKGIPDCSFARLIGCIRLGAIYDSEQDHLEAIKYYKRACDGGLSEGCEKAKEKDEQPLMLLYVGLGLIGLATFLVTNLLFQDESQFKATEQLEEGASKEKEQDHGIVLKYSRPFFKRYVSPIVGSMKIKKKIREKYKRPLASAGLSDLLTPEDFYSFKLFLILGFPVVFMAIRIFLEETWPLKLVFPIGALGFFYPDLWIRGKIEARQKEILMAMPFAVDMLALSVEAGLDFIAAMTKVVEKAKPSALVEEFELIMKEIKIGASRAEALRNLAWRTDLIQIASFTATLIAADSVGASIGPILKALCVEIRQKKSSEIEKKGATAATKILFPMLFLITPSVFIIVAAPIIIELVTQGG